MEKDTYFKLKGLSKTEPCPPLRCRQLDGFEGNADDSYGTFEH